MIVECILVALCVLVALYKRNETLNDAPSMILYLCGRDERATDYSVTWTPHNCIAKIGHSVVIEYNNQRSLIIVRRGATMTSVDTPPTGALALGVLAVRVHEALSVSEN